MDLAEFLLARIAEDERRLDLPDFFDEDSARGPGWGNRGECPFCGAYQFSGTEAVTEEAWWDHAEAAHQRSRVLAECDAKRRVVERFADVLGCDACGNSGVPGSVMHEDDCNGDARLQDAEAVLGFLALPYADHPDYANTVAT